MLIPGQTLALTIEKPAAGGRMIARCDGQVVLVAGAIPGERVTARIDRVGKGVAYAQSVSIDEPAADRREPFGDPLCGGCLYAHIAYRRQLDLKALVIADAFDRIARMALPAPVAVAASPDEGYRMRARLHWRGRQVGFFREGTHDLCDARATRQLLPATCDVLDRIGAGLRSLGLETVRELEVSENLDASQRVVHLDTNGPVDPRMLSGIARVDGLTGLTVSRQSMARAHHPGPGGQASVLSGDPHVTDILSIDGRSIQLRRHVLTFFQGNRYLLGALVLHVTGQIGQGDDVVDLYAGAGLFSVSSAVLRGASVTAVEGDCVAALDLARNANTAGGSIFAVHQPVEAFVGRSRASPAVVIVDPPRTGMSKEALQGAIGLRARKVVYVSCDVATLARDARRLSDAGYELERIDAFDLFPNTPHVETVVLSRIAGL